MFHPHMDVSLSLSSLSKNHFLKNNQQHRMVQVAENTYKPLDFSDKLYLL